LETTPAEEIPVEDEKPHTPAPKPAPRVVTPVQDFVQVSASGEGWRNHVVHFGKNKGRLLGELDDGSLQWYQTKWQPTPWQGQMKQIDLELRAALDSSMGKVATPDPVNLDEEIGEVPF